MFKKFTLLRSQRSRVFELLQEGQLEPAEFSWAKEEIAGSILVSRLNYREGTYYFQFSSHELNAWCVACPGRYRSMDYEYPKDWQEQEGQRGRKGRSAQDGLGIQEPAGIALVGCADHLVRCAVQNLATQIDVRQDSMGPVLPSWRRDQILTDALQGGP